MLHHVRMVVCSPLACVYAPKMYALKVPTVCVIIYDHFLMMIMRELPLHSDVHSDDIYSARNVNTHELSCWLP